MGAGSDALFLPGSGAGMHGWGPRDDQRLRLVERQRARLTVAGNALDPEDCRERLAMLGLLPDDDPDVTTT